MKVGIRCRRVGAFSWQWARCVVTGRDPSRPVGMNMARSGSQFHRQPCQDKGLRAQPAPTAQDAITRFERASQWHLRAIHIIIIRSIYSCSRRAV